MGQEVTLVAPVDLGVGARNDLELAMQTPQGLLILAVELRSDLFPA